MAMHWKTRDLFDFIWVFVSIAVALLPIVYWIKIPIYLSALPTIVCRLTGFAEKSEIRKNLLALWNSFLQPYAIIGLTVCGLIYQIPTDILLLVFGVYVSSLPLMIYVMKKWLFKAILESRQEDKPSKRPLIRTP